MASPPNGLLVSKRNQHSHRGKVLPRGSGEPRKSTDIYWGVDEQPEYLDQGDPNYDSDANVTFEELEPELSAQDLEKHAQPIIKEYFANGDVREAVDGPLVHRRVLNQKNVEKAFLDLLNVDLPDLVIDYPIAEETVGNFLGRAIADLALDSKFLDELVKDKDRTVSNPHATAALDRAETMMQQKHRLHDIWGVGGGQKPVRFLVRQMQLLLQEYLSSEDPKEAARCLRDLEVPHFHHEIVYQAGVMSIEMMHDRISVMLAELLRSLYSSGLLSVDAMQKGFDRLFHDLPDLSLDVPPAYTLAERWVAACENVGFLPNGIRQKVPHRGRKRFVSEGDDGRLKVLDVVHPLI